MKRMLLLTTLIPVLLLLSSRVSGQQWRGIQLLRSNCDDIKRALGVDRCEYPRTTYRLDDETVTVSFESCPCPTVCYHESSGWNVPPGTVESIVRQLHKPLPIANFDVSSRKWTTQTTDFIGQIIYDNKDDGITLSAIEGAVATITYYPPLEKFSELLCPKCFSPPQNQEENGIHSAAFTAYGENITVDQERARLNEFAAKLEKLGPRSKIYILAYDGCLSPKGTAQEYALRAKKYLIAKGIDDRRVIIVESGQRESMLIELHGRKRDTAAPKPFSSVYPNQKLP